MNVAVTAVVAEMFPTLPCLLKDIASAPGSRFQFHATASKIEKLPKKAMKRKRGTPGHLQKKTCILATHADREAAEKYYRELYVTPRNFVLRIKSTPDANCPGC